MTAEIVELTDATTGSTAEIAVNLGFNCYRFRAADANRGAGPPIEVLHSHPEFTAGGQRPSGSGIPILFPFPGRIPGTTFAWQGRSYELEPGDPLGNAIHGFVLRRPWRVIEQRADRVVGQFHAWQDDPGLRDRWPADFRITATYSLAKGTLRMHYRIENPCEVDLPCGLGTHPYFRLPLGGPAADDCLVRLPVTARWELNQMLPTGHRLELDDAAAYRAGRRFGELVLDDVFTGLAFEQGRFAAAIDDPAAGRSVGIRFDATFPHCVVYTPPHRTAICIEPYSCVPGGFALAASRPELGLRIVPPGAQFEATVEISCRMVDPQN
ncbi:MAG: aldose 1-epimerase [Pirellulaceae bacterium]